MKTSPIIALDFESAQKTFEFLRAFEGDVNVKVGMQLYYKEGPAIISKFERARVWYFPRLETA